MDHLDGGSVLSLASIGCLVLLTFAATLVFVPKNAIHLRIGAIVALGYFQYTFYIAVLNTSMTPAQKSNVALLSWGFYMSGTEHILISRVNVDDLHAKSGKDASSHVSCATLLFRAAGMYFNLRRVGMRSEISMKYRRTSGRPHFLYAKIIEVIGMYLIMDAVMSAPLPETHLITREKQTLFRFSNLSLEDVAFRFFGTLGYWLVTFICNRLNHACAAVVSLLLGLSKSEDWPHLNGPIGASYTVRGFWGTFWHQLYRKSLTGWVDFVADKVLGFRRGTLLSRYTRLFLAFLVSGVMHHCLGYLYSFSADERFATEKFYALQALGIMFEDAVQAVTASISLPKLIRRAVGYIWVLAFLSWSTPICSYPSMRGGDPGPMVPIQVIGPLMKS
ncbi:hypothetical protein NM208_g7503 [Fusarium decemcellulare]|uniref:Uncharacterized protein n=1 Tax=Fusarium decemcellulare TaxID=57161 RepID=A0ACC1S8X7_9HYPO|nr:hypothetical protein NM208_g7503 [Fusarium decemcellulare]